MSTEKDESGVPAADNGPAGKQPSLTQEQQILVNRGMLLFVGGFCVFAFIDTFAKPTGSVWNGLVSFLFGTVFMFIAWAYLRDKDIAGLYRCYRDGLVSCWNGDEDWAGNDVSIKPVLFSYLGLFGATHALVGLADIWMPLSVLGALALVTCIGWWFARLPEELRPNMAPSAAPELAREPQQAPSVTPASPEAKEDPIQTALDKVYGQLKK